MPGTTNKVYRTVLALYCIIIDQKLGGLKHANFLFYNSGDQKS